MANLNNFVIYFNDVFGRTIPEAQMYFYEAGTTTPKNTYTDTSLESTNKWPMVADGGGVFSPVFLESGGYRIVVKDSEGTLIHDRDNINVAENTVLSSSDFVFATLIDAKQGILLNNDSVSLQVGQAVTTLGDNALYDGLGMQWMVVPKGTGTSDDYNYSDLDNGLQLKRVGNYFNLANKFSEIADEGDAAQAEARDNLGIGGLIEVFSDDDGYDMGLSNISFTVADTGNGWYLIDYDTSEFQSEGSRDGMPIYYRHQLSKVQASNNSTAFDLQGNSTTATLINQSGSDRYVYKIYKMKGI